MIDFRYHLVSLIAVFLAIALGIVIGTTALNQPILTDIRGQVSTLEQDKRTLEDRTRRLEVQAPGVEGMAAGYPPIAILRTSRYSRRIVPRSPKARTPRIQP